MGFRKTNRQTARASKLASIRRKRQIQQRTVRREIGSASGKGSGALGRRRLTWRIMASDSDIVMRKQLPYILPLNDARVGDMLMFRYGKGDAKYGKGDVIGKYKGKGIVEVYYEEVSRGVKRMPIGHTSTNFEYSGRKKINLAALAKKFPGMFICKIQFSTRKGMLPKLDKL